MKPYIKRIFTLLLSLLLLCTLASCTTMNKLEQRLEVLENEETITAYYRETKNEREALSERMDKLFNCELEKDIVKGFEVYGKKSGRKVWIYEFETKADAKNAQDCFDEIDWEADYDSIKMYSVIRKGKLVFFGTEDLIDTIIG